MAHLTPTEPEQQEQSEIGRQLRPPSKEPGSSFERPTDDGESQSPTSNHQNFMSHLKGIFWLLFPRACIERNFTGPLKEAVQPLHQPKSYLEFGNYIGSDPSNQIFRRFGLLHTWALLDLQDELNKLEQGFIHNPRNIYQKDLMADTRKKLRDYGDLAKQQRRFMGLSQPNSVDHAGILRWASKSNDFRKPKDLEYNWVFQRDDLVTFAPDGGTSTSESWIVVFILLFPFRFAQKVFMNEYERRLAGRFPLGLWISSARLRKLVKFITVTIGLTFIIFPIAMLYFHVADWGKWPKLGLIAGFTILFTVFLKFSAKIMVQELLSYSSSYCALLVIFLGLTH